MTPLDIFALSLFLLLWFGFSNLAGGKQIIRRASLTQLMNEYRAHWLRNSLTRDWKMIDTQIISGLQNGTAFFASATMFALGSCFPLLGAEHQAQAIYAELPAFFQQGQNAFHLKVIGLASIFAYSFFKFGWSYRLFNYCSILFGSTLMVEAAKRHPEEADRALERAIKMNILAAKHFNSGLRAIFLAIGYIGWFLSPVVLIGTTVFVVAVLTRRQFFSEARDALL
jgi:uncharacterized membrane protein